MENHNIIEQKESNGIIERCSEGFREAGITTFEESIAEVNSVSALASADMAVLGVMKTAAASFDNEFGDAVIGWVERAMDHHRELESIIMAETESCDGGEYE